jgi:hypothetical protein
MTNILYMIVDTQEDPQEADPRDGMSVAFVRNAKGNIIRTRDLSKARNWRNKRNVGIDEGEPGFAVIAYNLDNDSQRLIS